MTVDEQWVDYSVLDEMARRLRSMGGWDNVLGDGIVLLKSRIDLLERFSRFESFVHEEIKRPLQTWEDCRKLLTRITASRACTFSDVPIPVELCLKVAVLLYQWEKDSKPIPHDIRGSMMGHLFVERADGSTLLI